MSGHTAKLTAGDLQIITRTILFRGLQPETVAHLVSPATAVELQAHESLVRQDDPATAFFIVIRGSVKLYRIARSGSETIIRVLTAGDVFAETSAFGGMPFLVSADAVVDSRVARIPVNHVVRCLHTNPDVALAMIASTSQHVTYLMREIEQLKAKSGLQRLAGFLVSSSNVAHGPCVVDLPYGKAVIASRLGLEPESLSRALAKLKPLGVAVRNSHIAISDVARLQRLASDDPTSIRGAHRAHA